MRGFFIAPQKNIYYRYLYSILACVLSVSLVLMPSASQAQTVLNLPIPGTMIQPSPAFVPVLLKGMTIHPDNPLQFDFIIDSGNTNFTSDEIKKESERLVKYFLASMTVPKDDLWVNLSPYENDRIIPEELGKTELGRDMLAQDYILKQLTASLMYPEEELGKKFWDKVYDKAEEQFGTREIPVNTFNKVWILPERATVYEHEQTVYVINAHLKVMLDSDYQAMQYEKPNAQDSNLELQSSIIKEIIIPEIEKEVNEGQHFAPLRQIYHSLILAKWYKETIKNSLLSQVYVDQNKIAGVESDDETVKDKIYSQYIEAYKKGVFNYIKEDYDRLSNEVIPRKYFSGGEFLRDINVEPEASLVAIREEVSKGDHLLSINMLPQKNDTSSPVTIPLTTQWYINRLSHKDYSVRANAVEVLDKRNDSKAIKPLIELLSDKSTHVRELVVKALRRLGATKEQMVNGYISALSAYDKGNVRASAAEELAKLGDSKAIDPLIEKLSDKSWIVRKSVAKALGQLGDLKAVEPLIKILSSDNEAGESAALALGQLGDSRAVEPLIEFLLDKNRYGHQSAVIALGQLGDSKAVEPLIESLSDNYKYIRQSAARALGRLGNKRAVELIFNRYLKELSSSDSGVRQSAIEILGQLGDTRAVEPLETLLKATSSTKEVYVPGTADFHWLSSDALYEGVEPGTPDHYETRDNDEYHAIQEALKILREGTSSPVTSEQVGGIDMNQIDVQRQGSVVDIQFDPVEMQEIINMGIDGFAPVIINLTPLPSILPLLGLEPQREEEFEVSRY